MAKKPLKLTPKKISNWLTVAIILSTIAALTSVSAFLYKNFYQTITQSKEILVLREKVALDMVNMEKFNSIIDKLAEKTKIKELGDITSPFH